MGLPAVPDTLSVSRSVYVPASMFTVAPAGAEPIAFWRVFHGSACVPGFASSPLCAT